MQAATQGRFAGGFPVVPGQCHGYLSVQSLMTLVFLISVAAVLEAQSTSVH